MAKRGFRSKPNDVVRSVKTLIGWTPDEHSAVDKNAVARKVPFAEFVRRAALGRKAPDVDYVTDIVVELSSITRTLRAIHAAMVEQGAQPPEADMLAVLNEAKAAMLRIER